MLVYLSVLDIFSNEVQIYLGRVLRSRARRRPIAGIGCARARL